MLEPSTPRASGLAVSFESSTIGTLQIDVTAHGSVPLTTGVVITDGGAAVLDLTLEP